MIPYQNVCPYQKKAFYRSGNIPQLFTQGEGDSLLAKAASSPGSQSAAKNSRLG
jgi:hypothetical protein